MGWSKRDVDEGKRLVTGQTQFQWQLGDLAKRVFASSLEGLRDYAEEIGISEDALQRYRKVAVTFPIGVRRMDLSWTVHQELYTHKNGVELLHERNWTVKAVREYLHKAPVGNRGSNVSVDAAAEQVKQALKNPEVAKAVARDTESAKAIAKASAKIVDPVRDKEEDARNGAIQSRMKGKTVPLGMIIVQYGLEEVLAAVEDANATDRPITNIPEVLDTVRRIVEELRINAFKHDVEASFPEVRA